MSKALDRMEKERRELQVTYEVPQGPPPPPPIVLPPMPLPVSKDPTEEPKPERWWMLVALLVVAGAFSMGRATRSR